MIMTNEEATQALAALGQIVVNLSISTAFPACRALAGKTGNHVTRPYHTCVGLVPDTNWAELFSLKLEAVDREAAQALRHAVATMPTVAAGAPPVTKAKSTATVTNLVTTTNTNVMAKAKASGKASPAPKFAPLR